MRKTKLTQCLLLSILIHLLLLIGINAYLIPTPGTPEWREIIPVDMVVVEENEELPPSSPTFKEAGVLQDALVAKAQTAMGTASSKPLEDLPGPIPKEGTFKPSLNVEQAPTLGVLPVGKEGKAVESERVVSRAPNPPIRLPVTSHSRPDQSPLFRPEEPTALTKAKKGGIPDDSTTLERITAPLGRSRPNPDFVSDLPPIPTISSPALPEEREMILARKEERQGTDLRRSTTLRTVKGAERKMGGIRVDTPLPGKTVPLEPLTLDFGKGGTFAGTGKGFSILLVLDTSGSVKGPPLEGIKRSAMEFVSLLREMDRCAVIAFNDEASLVIPLTSDKNRLKQGIAELITEGKNTVLFDALDKAFAILEGEKDRGRFVVLFSDGKDEGSQSNPHEVIEKARRSGISVFSLGYSRVEKRYLETLESISQSTGGIFTEAPHFREIVELFRAAGDGRGKKES